MLRSIPDSTETIQAGMVLALEPGIYIDGWGGFRHEHVVAVGAEQNHTLTHSLIDFGGGPPHDPTSDHSIRCTRVQGRRRKAGPNALERRGTCHTVGRAFRMVEPIRRECCRRCKRQEAFRRHAPRHARGAIPGYFLAHTYNFPNRPQTP